MNIGERMNSLTATDRLVAALEVEIKVIDLKHRDAAQLILRRAKECWYHDFKTQLACQKMQLVSDLLQIGLVVLARRVMDGQFDDGKDE